MNIKNIILSYYNKYFFKNINTLCYFRDVNSIDFKYYNHCVTDFEKLINHLTNYVNSSYNNYDLYMCGDSTTKMLEPHPIDYECIGEKISNNCKISILAFTCGAFHPIVYSEMFTLLPEQKISKLFLITLNLRSLSDEWFLRPSYQFQNIIAAIKYIRLNLNYKFFLKKYFISYYFYIRYCDYLYKKTINFTNNILKNTTLSYRKHLKMRSSMYYCYPHIYIKNRISKLIKTISILKSKNYKPVVYITPIDWQTLIDISEIQIVKNNICYIKSLLEKYCSVLDYSFLCDSSHFFGLEHLNTNGRNVLSNMISNYLLKNIQSCSINKYTAYGSTNHFVTRPDQMKNTSNYCQFIENLF